jgi:hypothetical protein
MKIYSSVLLATAFVGMVVRTAYAHGFGERYDLPVPLDLFVVGAAATVALSFVVIGFFVRSGSGGMRYPRYNLLRTPLLGVLIASPILQFLVRLASVALFGLVVAAALFGTDRPLENLSPTFVWVIWWVGMGYVSALLGNWWRLLNPWTIVYDWVHGLLGGGRESAMFTYPSRWDMWPALLAFLVFAWAENAYPSAAKPFNLGMMIVLYSIVTWAGMAAFGKQRWLVRGEAFSVLFGLFSRFSPTEVRVANRRVCGSCESDCRLDEECVDCYSCFERAARVDRELNLRPYGVGLTIPKRVSLATAGFVVLALATVTFDGLSETTLWLDFQNLVYSPISTFGGNTTAAVNTLGLLLVPLAFMVVYLGFSWGVGRLSGTPASVQEVALTFVFSLVPIALAYNMAHFISLLAIQGQFIIPLASDPFGQGWDVLGTADYRLNLTIINAKFVWYLSVGAIVLGHIVSVFVAHVISVAEVPDRKKALRGQYPMLALMVIYTASSLWIIAQPIVD